jgi:hypothetical protein
MSARGEMLPLGCWVAAALRKPGYPVAVRHHNALAGAHAAGAPRNFPPSPLACVNNFNPVLIGILKIHRPHAVTPNAHFVNLAGIVSELTPAARSRSSDT